MLNCVPGVVAWMATKRGYIDSCLLIAAFKGEGVLGQRVLEVLDDPERDLVVSDAVWLEVMLKPPLQPARGGSCIL